jgi:hypothetical protein
MIYRSNLTAPELAQHFDCTVCKPRNWSMGHDAISDQDYEPKCCFMTHDEAAILHNIAMRVGGRWADIGARLGWTAAHIATAGCSVEAIDPELAQQPFFARFTRNLRQCGLLGSVSTSALTSQEYFALKGAGPFSGVCIDGNHDAPCPEQDAIMAAAHLTEDGAIVFHDFWGKPIRDGVDYLLGVGFKARVYDTPNGMAVCWNGNFAPPDHIPDPAINWANVRRSRARDFDFSRVS